MSTPFLVGTFDSMITAVAGALMHPARPASSLRVDVRPELLSRSDEAWFCALDDQNPVLIVHSTIALRYYLAGVRWHDEGAHCPSWSDGCRCDLGEGA